MEEEFKDFISFFEKKEPELQDSENQTEIADDISDDSEQIEPQGAEIIEENGIKLKINREENIVKSIDVFCSCGKKARIDLDYNE